MKVDFIKELNKEQYKLVTAKSGPRLVLAGAGSGKTRTLIYNSLFNRTRFKSSENTFSYFY